MKWYDWYFLAWLVFLLIAGILAATLLRDYSPIVSMFTCVLGLALAIGVRVDWNKFKRRMKNG